jgi:hypothetical protein
MHSSSIRHGQALISSRQWPPAAIKQVMKAMGYAKWRIQIWSRGVLLLIRGYQYAK